MMRIALTLMTLLVAGTAQAESNVSNKFDGVYQGNAMPVVGMSTSACPELQLPEVTIAKGFLKSAKDPSQPAVSGFITEEGYVAAFMARAGQQRSAMDGRFEAGVISAGFIEATSGCMWVVHLWPRS